MLCYAKKTHHRSPSIHINDGVPLEFVGDSLRRKCALRAWDELPLLGVIMHMCLDHLIEATHISRTHRFFMPMTQEFVAMMPVAQVSRSSEFVRCGTLAPAVQSIESSATAIPEQAHTYVHAPVPPLVFHTPHSQFPNERYHIPYSSTSTQYHLAAHRHPTNTWHDRHRA